ncbi:MAG: helix-turn-helix domain-containing protein [Streptosporangiaceae bacterium]
MAVGPGRRKRADSRYAEQAARLAALLRDQRLQADLTQEELAVRAGIPLSTLRKIETGQVLEPCYFTVADILRALGVPVLELTAPTRT